MNPHIHNYSILLRVIQDVHLTSSKMTMVYAATCPDPAEVQWGVKQLSDETGPIRGRKGELLYDVSQKKDSRLAQWRRENENPYCVWMQTEEADSVHGPIQELWMQQHREVQSLVMLSIAA